MISSRLDNFELLCREIGDYVRDTGEVRVPMVIEYAQRKGFSINDTMQAIKYLVHKKSLVLGSDGIFNTLYPSSSLCSRQMPVKRVRGRNRRVEDEEYDSSLHEIGEEPDSLDGSPDACAEDLDNKDF